MARGDDLELWAQRFSADLGRGDGRAPFDRVVRRHLPTIRGLLDRDLTYPTLVAALGRAGALRVDGRQYAADQLYMAVRRAESRPAGEPRSGPPAVTEQHRRTRVVRRADISRTSSAAQESLLGLRPPADRGPISQEAAQPPAGPNQTPSQTTKDLTDEDVRAALRRLRKPAP